MFSFNENYLTLWIDSETSLLKSVMLGTGRGMSSVIPDIDKSYDPKSQESILNNTYPKPKAIEKEFKVVKKTLERYGVKVFRPKKIKNCNQVFTRDVAFVIEDKLICSNIIPERENEIHAMQENLISRINPNKLINLPDDAHIEGGDVILYNNFIFVGTYRGKDYALFKTARTNEKAVRMLKEFFPNKEVVMFDLHKSNTDPYQNILHLDCCFQPIGVNKAIVYKDGFVYKGDYNYITSIFGEENIFEITKEEMYLMFPNVLSISPEVVLVEKSFTRLINHLEDSWGIKVEKIPFFEISKMGGLLRCSTMPLSRVKNE